MNSKDKPVTPFHKSTLVYSYIYVSGDICVNKKIYNIHEWSNVVFCIKIENPNRRIKEIPSIYVFVFGSRHRIAAFLWPKR